MENSIDKLAAEKVLKARSELILARRFYGVLVSNVEPVPSRNFPTMATDSRRHFYNPDFVAKLPQTQLLAVQAHESEHDARHHSTRRGNRDPKKWNEACDFAINIDLKDEGFDLPSFALIDAKYRGMSAEDIYRSRELDEQRQQEQEQQSQDQDDEDEPADPYDDVDPDYDMGDDDEEPEDNEESKGNGSDEADDESEGNDEQSESGSGDDQSEPADDDESEGDGSGNEPEDGDEQSEGRGSGDQANGESEGEQQSEGDGQGDEASDQSEASEPSSSGDPGGMGEVLDAAEDAGEIAEQDMHWERVVRQAASLAKRAGQLPGHITREIERENNPAKDWREELRDFFESGSRQIETWNRPNRRFIGSGIYLPGHQKEGINKAAFLIDTSGSMDEVALKLVQNEAQAALDQGIIDNVVVVYGDVRVTRTDEYTETDQIEFDPRGGGGTKLKPLFDYVAEEHSDASLIVCFTDLELYDREDLSMQEPAVPVLFAVTGYPDRVKQLIANAPWNAPGIDVGAH